YKDQPFLPAALVVTRVISLPDETTVTADLGHKSVAAENTINHRVNLLNAPGAVVTGQSEEHLVLKVNEGHSYKPGDVLYGVPYHICPTVALYERAFIIEEGMLSGAWRIIARDRQIGS
ncbi:MAG: D-TA family PLP-dependent enzyme, partial [Sphingobacteriales bacterium]